MEDPRLGCVLEGRYRIIERLAQGGMGTVYRGERVGLGREVAIKFLHEWAASEPAFVKRFELEAHTMAKLQHANCAQVIDVGVLSAAPYVVMELVAGAPLIALIDEGAMAAPRAIEIVRQILAALDHAHGHGIVHRDIKPANVVVAASSEFGDQVKVLDFGLAKIMQTSSTLTGSFVVGTPTYLPPEQSLGQADARTDLYAAGVVLFELLTGAPPFLHDDAAELIDAHRNTLPPRLADRVPNRGCSDALERVVARALAKRPEDRFASAAEMARALEATPEGSGPRARAATPAPVGAVRSSDGTMVLGTDALLPFVPGREVERVSAPVSGSAPAPVSGSEPVSEPVPAAEPVPVPVPEAVPVPVPASVPAPAPESGSGSRPRRRATMAAHPRMWLAAAGAVAVLAVIVVVVLVSGGDAPAPKPAPPATAESTPAPAPVPADSPELARLRARVRGPDTSEEVMRALQRLATREASNAEIPLLLGQIYCEKLWVSDCLQAFRKAIALAPALRDDARLIERAMYGLGADGAHAEVRRFLAREIGAAAVPALEDVVRGRWRKEVKERAAATLGDLGAASP